jgi:predicted transcriptional regulator of viral defense system
MGKQIHLEKIEKLFDKSPVLDFKSIQRVVGTGKKGNYAKLLIFNLLKKGKLKKVGKGFYTKHSESTLSVFALKPSYLGLQCALSFHGVWEQETIPIILTTKKVRRGVRKIMDSNVLVRNIDKKYFFGFDLIRDGSFYLPYSDLEKTFIDMVVFNQEMSEDLVKIIKRRIDKNKLKNYLGKYSLAIKKRVEERVKC